MNILYYHIDQPVWLKAVEAGSVVLLAIGALLSASILLHKRCISAGSGQIRLPDTQHKASLTQKDQLGQTLLDNIPDLSDDQGYYVGEKRFWKQVTLLRSFYTLLVIATSALMGMKEYRCLATGSPESQTWMSTACKTTVCVYHALLCFQYAATLSIKFHQTLTYHLFTLSSLLFTHLFFITLGQFLVGGKTVPLSWLDYAILLLATAQFLTVGSIRCKPAERYDLTRVYNTAVGKAIKEPGLQQGPEINQAEEHANIITEESESIFNQVSFAWVTKHIIALANMEQADIPDLPGMTGFIRTQNTVRDAMGYAQIPLASKRWGSILPLLWNVWLPQWHMSLQYIAISLLLVPASYIPHVALQNVLSAIEQGHDQKRAMSWAVILICAKGVRKLLWMANFNNLSAYILPRMTIHAQYLLFSKLLTRNTFAQAGDTNKAGKIGGKDLTSKADILNLISSDVPGIARIGFTMVMLYRFHLELLLGGAYVWILLGPSGLWGLSMLVFTSVPAYLLTKVEYKIFERNVAARDKKVTLMQEAIQAISMIKLMAAEDFWYKRIKTARDEEFKRMTQARLLGALSGLLYQSAPVLIIVVAFAHYTWVTKQTLTATTAFTAIAVFDQLQPILMGLPANIAQMLQQTLSAKRIAAFLMTQDIDRLCQPAEGGDAPSPDNPLYIQGTIGWDISSVPHGPDATSSSSSLIRQSQEGFKLEDIDVKFKRGQLTLIAGKFGSGKTLMLLALLGEARLLDGKISYVSSQILPITTSSSLADWTLDPTGVAYVPQVAWLQSLSIRENILFGLPLDMDRYRAVIHAVGLLPDLEILEDADLTEIGERGKILSGGQKARVSLGRAVYSRASTLLLDDVISAVDAQTAQHIAHHCFNGPLMCGRTVIIASHAVELLAPLAQHAIFLQDGKAAWQGSGQEMMSTKYMTHLLAEDKDNSSLEADEGKDSGETETINGLLDKPKLQETESSGQDFIIQQAPLRTPKQLVLDEKREKGAVNFKHWREVFWFNGGWLFHIGMVVILLGVVLVPVATRRVLELWTHEKIDPVHQGSRIVFWVTLYSVISISELLLWSIFGLYRYHGALKAIKRIHNDMLHSLLHAKMSFFSKTRAGSIVQRFGPDLGGVRKCSEAVGEFGETVLSLIVSLVSVSVHGGWLFFGIAIVTLVLIYKPGQWYRRSAPQLRRLDNIIPGRINAIYAEAIAGVAVVRAFGTQSVLVDELLRTTNMKTCTWTWRLYWARWTNSLTLTIDTAIMLSIFSIVIASAHISASSAGFILAFAQTLSSNLEFFLIQLRDIELDAVNIERTAEYRGLEQEGSSHHQMPDKPTDDNAARERDLASAFDGWPSAGKVEVQELSARYGEDMPDILHKISFSVEGGTRVGIVGASGGGKSTLAKALFQFVDISHGRILIDGKDTAHIPLGELRRKLGIIAQDPILLSGSLRLNLDIECQYSDQQLYDALHQVQLIRKQKAGPEEELIDGSGGGRSTSRASSTTAVDAVECNAGANIFTNLDYEIKSGGDNLSAGQKQLVVLARALLNNHKILIMDEATASIDSATDAEISRVVHEEFTGATVLIIAHRLRTIMPCSKILVMDKGNLVQQGSPLQLIREKGGKFQQLCMAAGMDEYRQLLALAEQEAKKGQLVDVDV